MERKQGVSNLELMCEELEEEERAKEQRQEKKRQKKKRKKAKSGQLLLLDDGKENRSLEEEEEEEHCNKVGPHIPPHNILFKFPKIVSKILGRISFILLFLYKLR